MDQEMKGNSSRSCWSLVDRAKADAYDVEREKETETDVNAIARKH